MQVIGNKTDSQVFMLPPRQRPETAGFSMTTPLALQPFAQPSPAQVALYFGGLYQTMSNLASRAKTFLQSAWGSVKDYCTEVGQSLGLVKCKMRQEINANTARTQSYSPDVYASRQEYQRSAHHKMTQVIRQVATHAAQCLEGRQRKELGIDQIVDWSSASTTKYRLQEAKKKYPRAFAAPHLNQAIDMMDALTDNLSDMQRSNTMVALSERGKNRLESSFLALYCNSLKDPDLARIGRRVGEDVLGLSAATLKDAQEVPADELQRFHELYAKHQLPLFWLGRGLEQENKILGDKADKIIETNKPLQPFRNGTFKWCVKGIAAIGGFLIKLKVFALTGQWLNPSSIPGGTVVTMPDGTNVELPLDQRKPGAIDHGVAKVGEGIIEEMLDSKLSRRGLQFTESKLRPKSLRRPMVQIFTETEKIIKWIADRLNRPGAKITHEDEVKKAVETFETHEKENPDPFKYPYIREKWAILKAFNKALQGMKGKKKASEIDSSTARFTCEALQRMSRSLDSDTREAAYEIGRSLGLSETDIDDLKGPNAWI